MNSGIDGMLDARAYWDRFQSTATPTEKAASAMTRFGWTQYPDHGPGEELLGSPKSALELGCGIGHELAYLHRQGVDVTGVDTSSVVLGQAREAHPEVPAERFVHADVVEYLTVTKRRFDAVYSIFGAVWFHDPDLLLPLLFDRMPAGGRLVFAHFPPVPGCHGLSGSWWLPKGEPPVYVKRWHYSLEAWTALLSDHGFSVVRAEILEAPDPEHLGTLLVQAVAV